MKDETFLPHEGAGTDAAEDPRKADTDRKTGTPVRYKLYDKIKDQVSLRTIDAVILITAALIVGLLIYGIVTGGPQ